jgi:hypothetical protein
MGTLAKQRTNSRDRAQFRALAGPREARGSGDHGRRSVERPVGDAARRAAIPGRPGGQETTSKAKRRVNKKWPYRDPEFLSIALGVRAIEDGFSVAFYRLEHLLHVLKRDTDILPQRLRGKKYMSVALLTVDEIGFQPLSRLEAGMLFRVVSYRYQRGSMILTANKSVKDWPEILAGDEVMTTALLFHFRNSTSNGFFFIINRYYNTNIQNSLPIIYVDCAHIEGFKTHLSFNCQPISSIILAGTPTTFTLGFRSFVTTAPAPIRQFSPTVTFDIMVAFR